MLRLAAGSAADVLAQSLNASASRLGPLSTQNPQVGARAPVEQQVLHSSSKSSSYTLSVDKVQHQERFSSSSSEAAHTAGPSDGRDWKQQSPVRQLSQGLTLLPVLGSATPEAPTNMYTNLTHAGLAVSIGPPYAPPLGVTLEVSADGLDSTPDSPPSSLLQPLQAANQDNFSHASRTSSGESQRQQQQQQQQQQPQESSPHRWAAGMQPGLAVEEGGAASHERGGLIPDQHQHVELPLSPQPRLQVLTPRVSRAAAPEHHPLGAEETGVGSWHARQPAHKQTQGKQLQEADRPTQQAYAAPGVLSPPGAVAPVSSAPFTQDPPRAVQRSPPQQTDSGARVNLLRACSLYDANEPTGGPAAPTTRWGWRGGALDLTPPAATPNTPPCGIEARLTQAASQRQRARAAAYRPAPLRSVVPPDVPGGPAGGPHTARNGGVQGVAASSPTREGHTETGLGGGPADPLVRALGSAAAIRRLGLFQSALGDVQGEGGGAVLGAGLGSARAGTANPHGASAATASAEAVLLPTPEPVASPGACGAGSQNYRRPHEPPHPSASGPHGAETHLAAQGPSPLSASAAALLPGQVQSSLVGRIAAMLKHTSEARRSHRSSGGGGGHAPRGATRADLRAAQAALRTELRRLVRVELQSQGVAPSPVPLDALSDTSPPQAVTPSCPPPMEGNTPPQAATPTSVSSNTKDAAASSELCSQTAVVKGGSSAATFPPLVHEPAEGVSAVSTAQTLQSQQRQRAVERSAQRRLAGMMGRGVQRGSNLQQDTQASLARRRAVAADTLRRYHVLLKGCAPAHS